MAVAGRWVRFPLESQSASGRTNVWRVETVEGGVVLGVVRWHGPWRCYAFFPAAATLYERWCLRDIADFCEDETVHQRNMARACRAEPAIHQEEA